MPPACPLSIHVAFYLWYGTPSIDGRWTHWDHPTLPHWTKEVNERFPPHKPFEPPDAPHSPFYPERGLYSSRDPAALAAQMAELADAGVDSVMLSWWGQPCYAQRSTGLCEVPNRDSQNVSTDELVPAVLDAAAAAGIGVTWHLEPYDRRMPNSIADDLKYLYATYGTHPAVYRSGDRNLPIVFLYDVSAEHISGHGGAGSAQHMSEMMHQWKEVIKLLRGTPHDVVLLSLLHDSRDLDFVVHAGFDGAYSYFSSDGFTEGSTVAKWGELALKMRERRKLFVPSVGPGYNDTLIRPWNTQSTRPREGGRYYDRMWQAALDASPAMVTITSYNEWGEGTQIEPAKPHKTKTGATYSDYSNEGHNPRYYLERTKDWVARARRQAGCLETTSDPILDRREL